VPALSPTHPPAAGEEDADELLRHYIHEALTSKANGTSSKLYDE
jgi:hypothetical protein